MATSKEYLSFIIEQLSETEGISYRQMMGEYIIYINEKIAAYICDNRFLVKPVPTAVKLLPNAKLEPPYDGAKNMILVENVDDRDFLNRLIKEIYDELPVRKKKK